MYLPICRTRINVLRSSGLCGAKVTPDKSTKDTVSSIRHNTTVLWMGFEFRSAMMGISISNIKNTYLGSRIINEPIIKIPHTKTLVLDGFKFLIAAHFS